MNVRNVCFAAAFTIAVIPVAHAEQWFVLNASERRCIPAATTQWPTPLRFEQDAREGNMFLKTDIDRNDDGSINYVGVHVRLVSGKETVIVYMHDLAKCNSGVALMLGAKGELN